MRKKSVNYKKILITLFFITCIYIKRNHNKKVTVNFNSPFIFYNYLGPGRIYRTYLHRHRQPL